MGKAIKQIVPLILAMLFAGCAAMKPLSSTPPTRTLVLTEPFVLKKGLQTLTLPAGKYDASMEDPSGYYYPAPAKLIGHDFLGNYLLDGGIYSPKKSPAEFSAYHISPRYGNAAKWKLPKEFHPETK
jgi:hypothetical protein